MSDTTPSKQDSVFISYARADNEKPPYEDKAEGWVTFFWNNLRFELTDRGAKQAQLWLDRYQIEPQEAFTEKIEQALTQARFILTIFSNNWRQSEWCQRELQLFSEKHQNASKRFIPVYKHKVDWGNQLPTLLKDREAREGYQFFIEDKATHQVLEFYWRGLKNYEEYMARIKAIAEVILRELDPIRNQSLALPQSIPSFKRNVFIALTGSDLRDARQRLINDLKEEGIQVLPAESDMPDTAEQWEQLIQDALAHSELAILLLSDKRGMTVEGCTEPIVDYQMRRVRESSLPRIFCIAYQENTMDFINQRIGPIARNEEIYGEDITRLSQWLRKRLAPVTPTQNHSPPPVVAPEFQATLPLFSTIHILSAHPDDYESVIQIARNIQGYGIAVKPHRNVQDLPTKLESSVIIVPWGVASEPDLISLHSQLPADTLKKFLVLPGGDPIAKKHFFHEEMVLESNISLPTDRLQGKNFLVTLGLLSSGAST